MKALLSRRAGPAGRIRCGSTSCRPGAGAGRAAGPGPCLRDQLSRRADHRGQVPVPAAAAVRARRRDRRRGRGGRRGRRAAGRSASGWSPSPASAGWPKRSSCRPRRHSAAGRPQLRGRLGPAPDLCDLDPRASTTAAGCRRARHCWCSAPRAGSGWPRSSSARPRARASSPPCRREEKAAAAREAGADEAIVYPPGPFDKDGQKALAELFKAAVGPDGADVIYDPVGGDYAEPALRSIGWEGRYLVVGFPAGIPKLPLNLTLLKSCDVCGVFWGAFAARDPKANAAHVAELFRLWDEGRIAPKVSATYPLERGGEAIAAMAARQAIGKLVVTI